MYLLIWKKKAQRRGGGQKFTFHYVSINIHPADVLFQKPSPFTFHYVSINIQKLFQPVSRMLIYIPLCIY